MSTTSTDLINECLAHLHATHRDPLNKLNGSLDASQTTVLLTYDLAAIQAGAVISIDLEIMFVWSVSSLTATVQRAYAGTTAATHADASLVTVNPKFSQFHVLNEINSDLDDLSANGLFRVATTTFTYSAAVAGYVIPADDIIEILQVKYDAPGPSKQWPEILSYKIRRESDTGDFATGVSIDLYDGAYAGRDVRVTYAAPFVKFSGLAVAISTTGLPTTAYDLPAIGAAVRLQSFREPQRNFNEAQGAPRRAGEVPPGAQLTASQGLRQLRRDRVRGEASGLRKQWPTRKRVIK